MSIVEKTIRIEVKEGILPDAEQIETAIRQSGLEPIRWAIVDVQNNEYIVSVNGIAKQNL